MRHALLIVAALGLAMGAVRASPRSAAIRPFADYEETGYVAMSARDDYGARASKRRIARHLPPDVSLVLYGTSDDEDDRRRVLADYGRFIAESRVLYVALPRSMSGFWSRDAMPWPSLDPHGRLVLTDGRYRSSFEPDALLGSMLGATVLRHTYRFDGGNLMANHLGACYTVNARGSDRIPAAVFASHYGCKTLVRLPKIGGIGHIDERARFVSAHTILTDTPEYRAVFEAEGFTAVLVPRPRGANESYINALVVNGTAFVPEFGRPQDADALRIYRALGFTAVGIDSAALASRGNGSIHCITMNYPRVSGSVSAPDRRAEALRLR